ncbi:MAG: hypothetical protein ACYCW6_31790 [Candidatus Xenobia bacterium]
MHDERMDDGAELLKALREYRVARQTLLRALGCSISNRDPLAEFAERLAAAVLGGTLADFAIQGRGATCG